MQQKPSDKNIEITPLEAHEGPLNPDVPVELSRLRQMRLQQEITAGQHKARLQEMKAQIQPAALVPNTSTNDLEKIRTNLALLSDEIVSVTQSQKAKKETSVETPEPLQDVETWYKPQTWSSETKKQAEAVGWGVGIGVGVMGMALLVRAARKKTKEVVKSTGKKAGWLWGKVKWVIGLTVTAGLGYVGIRAFQEFRKLASFTSALEKAKSEYARLSQKPKELMDAAEKKILEAAEQKAQQLEMAIQNIKTKPEDRSTVQAKTEQKMDGVREGARKKGETQGAENHQPSEHDGTASPQKMGKEVLSASQPTLIARGMLIMDPPPDWEASKKTQNEQVTDILNAARGLNLTARAVLEAKENPFPIPTGTKDPASREKAREYVWALCKKNKGELPRIQKELRNEPTLLEFMERMSGAYAGASEYLDIIGGEKGNVMDALKNHDALRTLTNNEAFASDMKNFLAEYSDDGTINPEGIEKLNWKEFVMVLAGETGTIAGNEGARSEAENEGVRSENFDKVLSNIYAKMKDKDQTDVHRFMLPFFHEVFPRRDEKIETDEGQVHQYLIDRMPKHQALRMAFYTYLMKKGNPAGIVLMQGEVLKYIATEEKSFFSIDKNLALNRMLSNLAEEGLTGTSDAWKALPTIDPKIKDRASAMLRTAGVAGFQYTLLAAMGSIIETGKTGIAYASDHPIQATLAAEGVRQLHRFKAPIGYGMEESLKHMTAKNRAGYAGQNLWCKMFGFTSDELKIATANFDKGYKAIDELRGSIEGKRMAGMIDAASQTPYSKSAWVTLEKFARTNGCIDIADTAKHFADSSGVRRAFEMGQHSRLYRIPGFKQTLGVYDKVSPVRLAAKAVQTMNKVAPPPPASTLVRIGGRALSGGLGVAGAVLDTMEINKNTEELRKAEHEKNGLETERLRSRDTSLRGARAYNLGTGLGVLANPLLVSNPIGWVAIGGGIAVNITNEMLYTYAKKMNEQDAEYLTKSNEELQRIIHSDSLRSLSALHAYVLLNMPRYEIGEQEFLQSLEGTKWKNNLQQFTLDFQKGDTEATQLFQKQMYDYHGNIASAKMNMLQRLARSRNGGKTNGKELSRLLPEDYELADLYADLHVVHKSDTPNHDKVKAALTVMDERYSALGYDLHLLKTFEALDSSDKSEPIDSAGKELFRLMYENYGQSLKEGNLAFALRMDRILGSLSACVPKEKENEEAVESRYKIFRATFLSAFLKEDLRALATANPVTIDTVYQQVEQKTRALFARLTQENAVDTIDKTLHGQANEAEKNNAKASLNSLLETSGQLRYFCQHDVRNSVPSFNQQVKNSSLQAALQPIIDRRNEAPSGGKAGNLTADTANARERNQVIQSRAQALGANTMSEALLTLLDLPKT